MIPPASAHNWTTDRKRKQKSCNTCPLLGCLQWISLEYVNEIITVIKKQIKLIFLPLISFKNIILVT